MIFETPLLFQPQYFELNLDRTIAVVASDSAGLCVNFDTKAEVDINASFKVSHIKCVLYHAEEKEFLIISNQKDGVLGFYLFKFKEEKP